MGSVPTSITSFAHRRSRAGSTASFTYFPDEEEDAQPPSDEEAILDWEDERYEEESVDLEAGEHVPIRRTSSAYSRTSVGDRLLRSDSARTEGSRGNLGSRISQKIYILTEDLTIVVTGFRTNMVGFAIYITICIISFGLGYLILRWLPRLKVRLIGSPNLLSDCNWVVIEVSTPRLYQSIELRPTALESMERICHTGCTA